MKWKTQILRISCLLLGCLGTTAAAYAREIQDITFQGNTLIPGSTLQNQIESRPGGLYKPAQISEDIQRMYDLGLYSAVDVRMRNTNGRVSLIFDLQERPVISRIELDGNDHIKDEQIEETLTLSPDDILDPLTLKFYPQTIKEDVQRIKTLYHEEGYHHARIDAKLLPDPSDPDEHVILRYEIDEREKIVVKSIEFIGNEAFSDKELRKKMETRQKGFFSFITGSGKFEKDTFEIDLERVRFFYVDNGYIDAKVSDYSLNFKKDSSDLAITITLDEGDIYSFSDITITGNTVYSKGELHNILQAATNEPFSRTAIQKDIMAISRLYAQKGYLTPITSDKTQGKLLIDPTMKVDREHREVSLEYTIREGVPHVLNRITIAGNETTRDKVIRRELLQQEGDTLVKPKLERSRQRVFNLGFFEDVAFELEDAREEASVNLAVEVTERSVGSFNFGGGYSSIDSFFVTGGITYPNVFGLAHEIDFTATLSSSSQTFNLKYTVPRFLDSHYLVGVEAFKVEREYDSYDDARVGGGLRLGRKLTLNTLGSIKYAYEEIDITDVEDDASSFIREAEGKSSTSSTLLSLRYRNLNNVILPTKGVTTTLTGKLAGGFLQGDNDFYKLMFENNVYVPLYKELALRFNTELTYAKEYDDTDNVPIFERFFGGGASTIRGYEERSIGPKDENDESIGGNKRAVFSTELIIPVQDQIRLVPFFDMGDVYGADEEMDLSTFRKSVGIGMRLFTPFGLLRFDWGYKLDRESGESESEFHFGIGSL